MVTNWMVFSFLFFCLNLFLSFLINTTSFNSSAHAVRVEEGRIDEGHGALRDVAAQLHASYSPALPLPLSSKKVDV